MTFKEFVDTVDTPGGHIIVAVGIGFVGVIVAVIGILTNHDKIAEVSAVMVGFFSVASYAMRGTDRANSNSSKKSVETSESPEEKK